MTTILLSSTIRMFNLSIINIIFLYYKIVCFYCLINLKVDSIFEAVYFTTIKYIPTLYCETEITFLFAFRVPSSNNCPKVL
jgi:hypothetical protein